MDEIVREFLVESYENLDQLDQDLVALEGTPGSRELLRRVFRTIHTIKGTCGFLGFSRLESLTHAGEGLLSELRDGRRETNQATTEVLLRMVDAVREILSSIEATGAEGGTVVDDVIEQISAVLQDQASEAVPGRDIPADDPGGSADQPGVVTASDSAIRVSIDVLDTLMRQVGELVLTRNLITRLVDGQPDADLVRASQRLSPVVSELQDGVMKARLQPIGHLWAKLPRIVRDLAAACGRQVRLEVAGGDTELDRALLEAVKDPLTHLVRNAVDHGIEDVQTREAAGKPAEGVLTVRAYHAGGQVVVEVEDDGQGIDPGRVAQAAVAQGLRTPAQIASMGAADVLQLLFLPGFSMAEVVTNVSGRGVGLDVVHTRIGAIGGTTEVESTIGRGTTWRLRIPLTLAIISAVIVESAGERYAIPAGNVLELVAPDGESAVATIEYAGLTPVLRLREALLPLVGLRDVLGLSGAPGTGSEGEPGTANLVAVVRAGTRRFGLGVDGVLDTEDIVVKPLAHRLRAVGVYAGVTLLGDGRVSLILDVQGIAGRWLTGQSVEAAEEPRALPSQPAAVTRQVLVVGIGDQRRVAIPLASLTRVERVRGDAVEHVGEREVIQYREAIVPLVRLDRLLGVQADPTGPEPEQQNLFVVIFTHGARTVAVAVRDVLDIVEDDAERHSQVDDHGSTVLGEHVTELLDVRQAVLSGDPAFFGDEDGALSSAPGAAGASFGSVGGVG